MLYCCYCFILWLGTSVCGSAHAAINKHAVSTHHPSVRDYQSAKTVNPSSVLRSRLSPVTMKALEQRAYHVLQQARLSFNPMIHEPHHVNWRDYPQHYPSNSL